MVKFLKFYKEIKISPYRLIVSISRFKESFIEKIPYVIKLFVSKELVFLFTQFRLNVEKVDGFMSYVVITPQERIGFCRIGPCPDRLQSILD